MRKRLEAADERRLVAGVARLGGVALKFTSPGQRGVPDRIVLLPNYVAFVEMKRDNGRLDPLQEMWRERILGFGLNHEVLHGKEEVDHYLARLAAAGVGPA